MKGIVLAGGSGTRLHPVTEVTNKHLLPVYDKPMIHYPLSTLMLAGIDEILLISTPEDLPLYQDLLGDGSELGIEIEYAEQAEPRGIAEAFVIGEEFVGDDDVMLILGDNIFYGHGLAPILQDAVEDNDGATIFGYYVKDPERYGVAEIGDQGEVVSLEEKPDEPKSNYAVTGLYIYDSEAAEKAKQLSPSDRGELEITDLNQRYLDEGRLDIVQLGRGFAWLDTGTHQSLNNASSFIETIEERQGLKIACLEEVAYRMGYIDEDQLARLAKEAPTDDYRAYLERILSEPATQNVSSPYGPPRP